MTKLGFEIIQYSLCDGWVNNLYDSNDEPLSFLTLEEAILELQDEFDCWRAEIVDGKRREDEGYDIESFQIVDNHTGIVYELDMISYKIVIASGKTNN